MNETTRVERFVQEAAEHVENGNKEGVSDLIREAIYHTWMLVAERLGVSCSDFTAEQLLEMIQIKPAQHEPTVARILAAAAEQGEGALALALQLTGTAPCSRCGFIATKCRCAKAPAKPDDIKTDWACWFPTTVLGQPMREFAPGRWESARWPSDSKD